MQHFTSLGDVRLADAWLTIGSFDGVHLGHRQILGELTAGAHAVGAPAVVLTFFPHPAVVLRAPRQHEYLTDPEEKAVLLGQAGVDVVITHPFNEDVSHIPAADFMAQLHAHLGLTQLWVGHDFALGHNREGDLPTLREIGQQLGYTVHAIDAITVDGGQIVSSSLIRQLLRQGEVVEAGSLLGRPYRLAGEVVHGDKRGRTIDIPTANLSIWPERLIPGIGVYACRAHLAGVAYGAVTNVGVRPTFKHDDAPHVETHLLDFDQGEVYGQEIQLEFLARLRNEKRFSSVQELITQIHADIAKARVLLAGRM